MKPFYSVLLMAWVLSFSEICAQNTQKLFFAGENYPWQTQFSKDNGVPQVYMIYQHNFVSSTGMTFDKKVMEKWMDKIIPDKNATGYGILDWENDVYMVIAGFYTASTSLYQKDLNQFIAALRYAKYLRPNIKWSYYFMPTFLYTQYSEIYTLRHNKRLPLLRELDFLAPSFYVDYDGKEVEIAFVSQYIDANLKYSIDLGRKLNKPVYCFVWHRYCPGANKINGNKLIDYVTFKKQISRIINTRLYNKRIDGLIWWNCEDYLYLNRAGDPIMTSEYQNVTDPTAYKKSVLQNYLDTLRVVMYK